MSQRGRRPRNGDFSPGTRRDSKVDCCESAYIRAFKLADGGATENSLSGLMWVPGALARGI
jgi:hypothetical protein